MNELKYFYGGSKTSWLFIKLGLDRVGWYYWDGRKQGKYVGPYQTRRGANLAMRRMYLMEFIDIY